MAVAARGRGSGGGSAFSGGLRNFFTYRIFVSAMFTLLFLATLSVLFTSHPASYHDSGIPTTGNAYVHRTFLALKSDPLKTRLDLINKQANDHVALVNAYAAYARKLKLDSSRQLRMFDDLARNFSELVSKPSYQSSLFESDGPVDEDVLRQLEKEVKDKVKTARLIIAEAKESYDNQLKIQKLKDTIFAVNELLIKAKKNGAFASIIASKSTPKSLHCLAMRLMGERIAHPESYKDDKPKPQFEDPTLYHYAIFSDNLIAVSVVVNSIVKNAEEPSKHVIHIVTDKMNLVAMKVWFKRSPVEGGAHVEVKSVEDFTFLNSSYAPVLRQLESVNMQKFYLENRAENATKDMNNMKFRSPNYLSMLNHLRFYLPEMYPKLHRIVFLDDDVVVQKDLTALWKIDMDGKVNGAVETCFGSFHRYAQYLNFSNPLIREKFNPKACAWAFGMNTFDLDAWSLCLCLSFSEMQLLQAPSSPHLTFQNPKSQFKEGLLLPSEKLFHLSTITSSFVKSPKHVKHIWASRNRPFLSSISARAASVEAGASEVPTEAAAADVLKALSQIIDPDFGTDIVSCGFVKDLHIHEASGEVSFRLELTTPACPIKDMFEQRANEVVAALPWVRTVNVIMSAQPARPVFVGDLPLGLQTISNIVAVSSCKGGVGKSTVAVNLAYTLAGMGARVGIFDADVYGPSLPTMVSPENRLLEMNAEKRTIIPTEYLGVKLVSFGFAGQGRAIMRGPMVSGVINQLLTTTEWGELDYLVIDMPPGTGDIQLTLCQVVPLTAAVIVTTPQKLAFIDVAKGVRMFSKLKVPCVAVVENMCHFDADGKRYYPFGRGSGSQVVLQFGIPHLFDLPIRPTLSASGDSGMPEVVDDPQGEIAKTFQDLGVCVVQQCAKIRQQVSTAVTYDKSIKAIRVKVPDSDEEFLLHPATVRRNDRSAQSVDEWTGEQKLQYTDVPEDIEPEEIRPMGNYAVSITWPDGFSQIAPYDQLQTIERLVDVPQPTPAQA